MARTRKAIIHPYVPCRTCEHKISGYGVCQKGYENFYYRKGKNNNCEKCLNWQKEQKLVDLWYNEWRRKKR